MKDTTAVSFDFDYFVDCCVQLALRSNDLSEYQTRYLRVERSVFPPPPQGNLRDDDSLRRRLGLAMARAIWHGLPLPALDFACPRAVSLKRNETCYCGSGAKYKQCCEPLARNVPLRDVNLLPQVLDYVPRTAWKQLPGSSVEIDRIAHVAQQWLQEGDEKSVLALLEPWFAGEDSFVARRELLFDLLLNLYFDLNKPRKKARLLDRAMRFGDKKLRSGALQRLASIASDKGDYARAWELFGQARQIDPGAVSLSHLEVTMLISEGREEEARHCAALWIQRLSRMRDPKLQPLIDVLRQLQRGGGEALDRLNESLSLDRFFAS
jgi:tetratricopeptide (TPR) repeat protein